VREDDVVVEVHRRPHPPRLGVLPGIVRHLRRSACYVQAHITWITYKTESRDRKENLIWTCNSFLVLRDS
jgi:hypothetical protein